jgi:peptide chain release factor 1
MRASGPGGQKVNKTDSACRVTHLPTGISVKNFEERDQAANKARALEILTQQLFESAQDEKMKEYSINRKS